MILSILAAMLGVLGTAIGLTRGRRFLQTPYLCWIVGLLALFPAWLIAFLGLLGPAPIGRGMARPEPAWEVAFILSAAASLAGVIATEAAIRRLSEAERVQGAWTYWLLGVAALAPAWAIALLGLVFVGS